MLRILHAADLHLDSPFAGLSPEQAAQRRKLQRQLPDRIVDLCHLHRCDLLLLSGDVFDGARVCPETVEALQRAFESDREKAARYAEVLYGQALLIAGLPLEDPAAYASLVCSLMV